MQNQAPMQWPCSVSFSITNQKLLGEGVILTEKSLIGAKDFSFKALKFC